MDCNHDFRHTQGHFFCTRCGMTVTEGEQAHPGNQNWQDPDGLNRIRNEGSLPMPEKHRSKKPIVFLCVIATLCSLLVIGTMAADSDQYLDVGLSMTFYYNVFSDMLHKVETGRIHDIFADRIGGDQIFGDVLDGILETPDTYFKSIGKKTEKDIKEKRNEDENRRMEEQDRQREAALLAKKDLQMEYELLIHAYTNEERTRQNLESLDLDEKISNVARLHSTDMAVNDYFAHQNLKDQSPTDRGTASEVTCIKNYITHYTEGLAENISHIEGYGTDNVRDNSKMIVDGWMNSKGHRENILNSAYDRIGIGVEISGSKIYATQNFC